MGLCLTNKLVMCESHPQFRVGAGQITHSVHILLSWSKIQIMILKYRVL